MNTFDCQEALRICILNQSKLRKNGNVILSLWK